MPILKFQQQVEVMHQTDGIVAILSAADGQSVCGMGVLFDERHVVTCAHVVDQAFNRGEPQTIPQEEDELTLRFLFSKQSNRERFAEVVGWRPREYGVPPRDIAILRLKQAAPVDVKPALFSVPSAFEDLQVKAYGISNSGAGEGHAEGKLIGEISGGFLQIDGLRHTGKAVDHGYSGGGVWSRDSEALLGILVEKSRRDTERICYMIPAETLREAWPGIPLRRGDAQKPNAEGRYRHPVTSAAKLLVPMSGFLVGRDAAMRMLDDIWVNGEFVEDEIARPVQIVQLTADGGIGKTTLVWHWLNKIKREHPTPYDHLLEWSFFSQDRNQYVFDSRAFFAAAIEHFKAVVERFAPDRKDLLAKIEHADQTPSENVRGKVIGELVAAFRGIVVLDGTEPLQNPPDRDEGTMHDAGLIGFLGYLRNQPVDPIHRWLVIITTRYADPRLEGPFVLSRSLERLSAPEGADLLKRFHLKDDDRHLTFDPHTNLGREEAIQREFETASEEFGGHPLSLALLASFLLYARNGDLQQRRTIARLDTGRYQHARRVMSSYDLYFSESGSPVAQASRQVLCLLGLFNRPTHLGVLEAIVDPPIQGLTDALATKRVREAVVELRRLRILNSTTEGRQELDCHPLIREHFGREVLEKRFPDAWREGHSRLFEYFRTSTGEHPCTADEMDRLLQAVVHGCDAGRHSEALHEVYIPRVMQGRKYDAYVRFGMTGPLLSALSHFFALGRWNDPLGQTGGSSGLTRDDQITVLSHAALFLMVTRGYADPDVEGICEKALSLAETADPQVRFSAISQFWIYDLVKADLNKAWDFARELLALAQRAECSERVMEAEYSAGVTLLMNSRFQESREHLERAISLYDYEKHSYLAFIHIHDVGVGARCFLGRVYGYLGEQERALAVTKQAHELAEQIGHPYTLVFSEVYSGWTHLDRGDSVVALGHFDTARQTCLKYGFWFWEAVASLLRARILVEQPDRVEEARREAVRGTQSYRDSGAQLALPEFLGLAAEVHLLCGDIVQARELLDDAYLAARKVGYQQELDLPRLYVVEAELLLREGKSEEVATERVLQARQMAREQKSRGVEHLVLTRARKAGLPTHAEGIGSREGPD